jgi:hypothetical protein
VLLGGAGAIGLVAIGGLAAACGGGDDEDSSDTTVGEETKNLLSVFNAQGPFLITGAEQRITYALADFEGVPVEGPESLTFRLVPPSGGDGTEVDADRHDEGVPTPYYPLRFTPDEEGIWTALVEVDGQEAEASFSVSPPEDVTVLARGAAVPRVETATVTAPGGVDPVCTAEPPCALHDVTLAEALDEGTPIALLVATPAFCATAVCGPVLDVLLAVQEQLPDVRYLHAEVYENPLAVDNVAQATPTALTQELGLTYEPSLFLIGADGTLVDRLDNIYDEAEAAQAIEALSAG